MPAELPHMNEMLKDFMQRRTAVHAAGLAAIDRGEVEPYDAVPPQVLAYELALRRGLDPDKPRNLAKSVTVE